MPASDGNGGKPGKAETSTPPVDRVAPPGEARRPATETLDGIVNEGERELVALGRRTGRAVFKDPARVTPRVLTRLGEIGVAEFVQQIRADANFLISRARANSLIEDSGEPEDQPADAAPAPAAAAKLRPKQRRPAPFGKLTSAAKPSLAAKIVGCVPHGLSTFLSDLALYSYLVLLALILSVVGFRVLIFLFS